MNILYMHTKGVTRCDNRNVKHWASYMQHFLVDKHQRCIDDLNAGVSCVGVDYHQTPLPHFSGNFWWASGEYIASKRNTTLPQSAIDVGVTSQRWFCEFWLLDDCNPKISVLHNSGVDLYAVPYTEDKYLLNV
jgi:hypothetical protein